ncbi:hypothetical protein LUZ61_021096 [Rhynchospora tenuis]|uniref:Uncharacterized protein n=1 Tax=Rhynchospora tenuis TaxID=198213 RepID=A0AAD5Z1B1_9POAL|nr:hypothetical protein LUZ61_021096 [Rhynchospora tenuis]
MEEFLESEVVWPENLQANSVCYETITNPANQQTTALNYSNGNTASTPITIPGTSSSTLSCGQADWCKEECTDEQVLPHVLVSRRKNTGKLAFPLCSGQGRTLKGRDLRDVRNAVWRMTGFLDG